MKKKTSNETLLLNKTHPKFIEFMDGKISEGEITAGIEKCKQTLHNSFLNKYPEMRDDKSGKRMGIFTIWLRRFAKYSPLFDKKMVERKCRDKRFFTFRAVQQ